MCENFVKKELNKKKENNKIPFVIAMGALRRSIVDYLLESFAV